MGAEQRGQGAQLRNFVGDEMSDLRKAAQEALEALEYIAKDSFEPFGIPLPGEIDITMDELRAALAQPEQTAMPPDIAKVLFDNVESLYVADDLPQLTKWTPMAEYAAKSAAVPGRAEALKQAGYTRRPRQLPKEDEQEPVAWLQTENFIDPEGLWDERKTFNCEGDGTPLYTAPPQRKPLTDDEIKNIVDLGLQTWKLSESTYAFARAIEAAHGIGGEHE